jgi:hypothetical protein
VSGTTSPVVTVSGTITTSQKLTLISPAEVSLTVGNVDYDTQVTLTQDVDGSESGTYSITNVPVGTYTIVAVLTGADWNTTDFSYSKDGGPPQPIKPTTSERDQTKGTFVLAGVSITDSVTIDFEVRAQVKNKSGK